MRNFRARAQRTFTFLARARTERCLSRFYIKASRKLRLAAAERSFSSCSWKQHEDLALCAHKCRSDVRARGVLLFFPNASIRVCTCDCAWGTAGAVRCARWLTREVRLLDLLAWDFLMGVFRLLGDLMFIVFWVLWVVRVFRRLNCIFCIIRWLRFTRMTAFQSTFGFDSVHCEYWQLTVIVLSRKST